jgi:methyl-CpG-binding domain protein 4
MNVQALRDDLMVQEQLPATNLFIRGWQHMVAVIMLNQTGRTPVKQILPLFLSKWSTPTDFVIAPEQAVKDVIWSLGMMNVRYTRLKRMTQDYLTWDMNDATELYGIGKYGSDSYEIFFKNNYTVDPADKELKRYLEE